MPKRVNSADHRVGLDRFYGDETRSEEDKNRIRESDALLDTLLFADLGDHSAVKALSKPPMYADEEKFYQWMFENYYTYALQQELGDEWLFLNDVATVKLVATKPLSTSVPQNSGTDTPSILQFILGSGGNDRGNYPGEILFTTRGCVVAASTKDQIEDVGSQIGGGKSKNNKTDSSAIPAIEGVQVSICMMGACTKVDSYDDVKRLKNVMPVDSKSTYPINGVGTRRSSGPRFIACIWDDIVRENLVSTVRDALTVSAEEWKRRNNANSAANSAAAEAVKNKKKKNDTAKDSRKKEVKPEGFVTKAMIERAKKVLNVATNATSYFDVFNFLVRPENRLVCS